MSDEIRTQVTEILAHAGVSFSAVCLGEKKNAMGGNTPMDQWACMFTRTESTRQAVEFDFFTGIGHRKAPGWGPGVGGYDNGPAPRPGPALLIARANAIAGTITERHVNICAGRMRGSWAQYPNQDHIAWFAPKRKGCDIRRDRLTPTPCACLNGRSSRGQWWPR